MKFLTSMMLVAAISLAGCASTDKDNGTKSAAANDVDSYVALGSNIPKKGSKRIGDQATNVDLQQMENERTMGGGTNNSTQR